MGKQKNKTNTRLERRQKAFENDSKRAKSFDTHKPGSQNRNKK